MRQMLEVGAQGASRVKLLLARRFGVLIDYEGDREKQRRGIDLKIQPWGYVEVKTDRHDTTNFFFEFECSGKPSGIMTSQASWYAYYFPLLDCIYMLPVVQLRQYIKKNWNWFTAKYKRKVLSHSSNRGWSATGFALPRDYICAAMPVVIYNDYKNRLWLVAGEEKKHEKSASNKKGNTIEP